MKSARPIVLTRAEAATLRHLLKSALDVREVLAMVLPKLKGPKTARRGKTIRGYAIHHSQRLARCTDAASKLFEARDRQPEETPF